MQEIRKPGVYLDRSGRECFVHFFASDGEGFDEAHGISGTTGMHGTWCPYSGRWFHNAGNGCADIVKRVRDLGPDDHGFQGWDAAFAEAAAGEVAL